MILNIDTEDKDFLVTMEPAPKNDQHGQQRVDKTSGEPLWTTQVVATDKSGGEIINVTTAGKRPDVVVGDAVDIDNLVAIPWSTNGRSGIAYRADAIRDFGA